MREAKPPKKTRKTPRDDGPVLIAPQVRAQSIPLAGASSGPSLLVRPQHGLGPSSPPLRLSSAQYRYFVHDQLRPFPGVKTIREALLVDPGMPRIYMNFYFLIGTAVCLKRTESADIFPNSLAASLTLVMPPCSPIAVHTAESFDFTPRSRFLHFSPPMKEKPLLSSAAQPRVVHLRFAFRVSPPRIVLVTVDVPSFPRSWC